MGKITDSLVFKFAIIFFIFTVVTLSLTGVNTYISHRDSYQNQCRENIENLCTYLEKLIQADGENFATFQEWWTDHLDDVLVPLDFSGDWRPQKEAFESRFAKRYPGKVFGKDIKFSALDFETQKSWAVWQFEYWLHIFEEARPAFNVIYTYYMFPRGDDQHLYFMIDALREPFENPTKEQEGMIDILDDFFDEKLEDNPIAKKTWETGERFLEYDEYDNEYGRTYAYVVPLKINGKVYGLIGVDILVEEFFNQIKRLTLRQMVGVGAILVIAVLLTLVFIYRRYITKLVHLQHNVQDYTRKKDAGVIKEIESDTHGRDEIAVLSSQVAAMILEIQNYIKNLLATTKELSDTKTLARELNELAVKDALTGIRNKTAYDREIKKLSEQISEGLTNCGLAIIDLNFLKRVNDTYGHEQGSEVIKRLCHIVCVVFEHSPVFRIGGDEFAVILKGHDAEHIEELKKKFFDSLEATGKEEGAEPWEHISAAIGVAFYDASLGDGIAGIFKRADQNMYENKKAMKGARE